MEDTAHRSRYPEAARVLGEFFEEIFEGYERSLVEAGSLLLIVGDGTTKDQLRKYAGYVIERAAKVLGSEERSLLAVGITPKQVTAMVRDYGGGFETDEPAGEGLVLRPMEERASLLGRTFSLGPDPEGGARAGGRLPLVKGKGA